MALTTEQLGQLTALLGSPVVPCGPRVCQGPERREAPRSPARGPAELRAVIAGGALGVTVFVQDVSLGDVGFLSGSALAPQSTVELLVSNGYDDVTLRCSVRHCTAVAAGLYAVGADVVVFEARQGQLEVPCDEAAAAWAGFFGDDEALAAGRSR